MLLSPTRKMVAQLEAQLDDDLNTFSMLGVVRLMIFWTILAFVGALLLSLFMAHLEWLILIDQTLGSLKWEYSLKPMVRVAWDFKLVAMCISAAGVVTQGIIPTAYHFRYDIINQFPRHIKLGVITIQLRNTEDIQAELEKACDLLQAYKCNICHVEVADCIMVKCRHLATCMECTTTLQNLRLLQGGCEDRGCLSCIMRRPGHTHCLKCNLAGAYEKVFVG